MSPRAEPLVDRVRRTRDGNLSKVSDAWDAALMRWRAVCHSSAFCDSGIHVQRRSADLGPANHSTFKITRNRGRAENCEQYAHISQTMFITRWGNPWNHQCKVSQGRGNLRENGLASTFMISLRVNSTGERQKLETMVANCQHGFGHLMTAHDGKS